MHHFEGSNFKRRVVASVVTVLHPRQPLKPMARTVTYKATQIHLDSAIDNLYLSITLRVISRAESQFSSTQPKQFSPKQTRERYITITHNSRTQAMKFENIIKEQVGYTHNSKWMSKGKEMCIL